MCTSRLPLEGARRAGSDLQSFRERAALQSCSCWKRERENVQIGGSTQQAAVVPVAVVEFHWKSALLRRRALLFGLHPPVEPFVRPANSALKQHTKTVFVVREEDPLEPVELGASSVSSPMRDESAPDSIRQGMRCRTQWGRYVEWPGKRESYEKRGGRKRANSSQRRG